jgi:hypothetical protein
MDYRLLRIFVSSRMQELADERQRIKAALAGIRINAWIFEDDAGARTGTIEETYLDELDKADLYLGIFWRGFGTYTIEEYEHAKKRGKDRLIYEKTADIAGTRDPELQTFLDRIGQVKLGETPARFETVDRLVEHVLLDVPALLTARFRKQRAGMSGAPFQTPALRSGYVPRPALLDPLSANLASPHDPSMFRVIALHGMPGSGKSELATAAARDARVLNRFPDGVLWGVLGLEPNLSGLLSGWIQALGDRDWRGGDASAGQERLRTLLQDRAVLLVLDDAWNAEHVIQLIAGGPRCAALITTREAVVARAAQAATADTIEVGVMSGDEAVAVLAGGPGQTLAAADRAHAIEVADAVGFLPLALNLARSQIVDGVPLSELALELRRETQRLETLDDAALETIANESLRRQLSLVASVSVSLRRLPPQRLQQLAWFGVLPDDVSVPASAAATLWAIDEPSARLAMRNLRSSGLLLTGEPAADGALTYRLHDVIHTMAKRLLAAPEIAPSPSQLPGLGLTEQAAQRAFLSRHRARCTAAGGWHTLSDDGYIFDHLTWHLDRAGESEEVHALLREEDDAGRNGWFVAREQLGQTSAYASDLRHGLQLSGRDLGRGLRYALMLASLRSIATAIPPSLLARLLDSGIWPLEQALAYANQSCGAGQRSRALALIAEGQPPAHKTALLLEAFAAAQEMEDDNANVLAFVAVTLANGGLIDEALDTARKAEEGDPRVSALVAVIAHLDEDRRGPVIAEALASSQHTNELFRAAAVAPILPWLDAAQVRTLIGDAAAMEAEFFKGQVLAALNVRLAALGNADEALTNARSIVEPSSRALAFVELAPYVSADQRGDLVNQALDLAAGVSNEAWSAQLDNALEGMNEAARAIVAFSQAHTSWRAELLAALPADLPPAVVQRALALALDDENPEFAARNFAALAPRLDATTCRHARQQIIQRLWEADTPATTLDGLATLLPHADEERGALLERVWQVFGADDARRDDLLAAFLHLLEDDELEQPLELIAAVDDRDLRGQFIESIAGRLPARLVSRARDIARAIGDRDEHLFAEACLAAHLDVAAAAKVLKSADHLSPHMWRGAVLSLFPDGIASQLVDQALSIDEQRTDKTSLPIWQVRTYAPLVAPARRMELFDRAAESVAGGDDLEAMCDVLSAAARALPAADVMRMLERLTARAEKLPDLQIGLANVRLRVAAAPSLDAAGKAALLSAAYQTALEQVAQDGGSPDADLLNFLLQESPPAALDLLLQMFDEIEDPFERARAYGRVLPLAPAARHDELVGRALERFDEVKADEYLTADEKAQIIGSWIMPYSSNVNSVLDVVSGFESNEWRARALIAVAPKVNATTFAQALTIARTLEPAERGQALLALERAAPGETASSLLQEAWEAAMQVESDLYNDDLLTALTERLCQLAPTATLDFLNERLVDLARLSRHWLLVKIKYLAPALAHAGGPELVSAVSGAVDDVERWWR